MATTEIQDAVLSPNIFGDSVIILLDGIGCSEEAVITPSLGEDQHVMYVSLQEPLTLASESSTSPIVPKSRQRTERIIGDGLKIEEKLQVLETMVSSCEQRSILSDAENRVSEASSDIEGEGLTHENGYFCKLCRKSFTKSTQYYGHLHKHAGESVWKCEHCPHGQAEFMSLSHLRKHEQSNHYTPYKCGICSATFASLKLLENHRKRAHTKAVKYCCSFCDKSFYKRSDLRNHLAIHLSLQQSVCEVCGRSFSHISNLIRHSYLHSGVKPYPCKICGQRFTQLSSLKQHKISHHENLSVPCPALPVECGKVFRTPLFARQHARRMHPEVPLKETTLDPCGIRQRRSYYCRNCGESFQRAKDRQEHRKQHHAVPPSCHNSINETIKTHNELECSAQIHDPNTNHITGSKSKSVNESPFNIEVKSQIENKNNLNSSKLSPQIGQDEPEDSYANGSALGAFEENTAEQESNVPGSSLVSDKRITSRGLSETKTEVESYLTVDSGDLSAQIASLLQGDDDTSDEIVIYISEGDNTCHKVHVKSVPNMKHDAGTPNNEIVPALDPSKSSSPSLSVPDSKQCSECGKHFEKMSNLKQHLGTHFAHLQRYECSVCNQHFAWKSSLNKHIIAHHADPQPKVTCDACGKQYSSVSLLQNHIRRDHLQLRPHTCNMCSKAFFKKHDLLTHIRVHTKEEPYMCGTCGKTFYHLSHLKRHELIHQGIRRHQCSSCGHLFSQASGLKAHRQRSGSCNVT